MFLFVLVSNYLPQPLQPPFGFGYDFAIISLGF
jgi:hypothetical protein